MSDLNTSCFGHHSRFRSLAAALLFCGAAVTGCFGTNEDVVASTGPCAADTTLCTPRATLISIGKTVFEGNCAFCHGATGRGTAGNTPPLANADFFMANRSQVIRIVLDGYADSVFVNGLWYKQNMPAQDEAQSIQEIAAVLTYLRTQLNDSLVVPGSCAGPLDAQGFPPCEKIPRSAAEIAADSVAVWEVKAARDSLCPKADKTISCSSS